MKEPSCPRNPGRNTLILILLLTLILAPRPAAGYLDLEAARRAQAAGNFAEAATAYVSAASRIPWQPSLWEQAGLNAQLGGDPENAILFLNKAVERKAISGWGWTYLGMAYRQRGEMPSAVKAWERALPQAEAYTFLALSHQEAGDFPAALEDWRASLAQEPDNAAVHYHLGLLLAATAPEQALPELMRSVELNPGLEDHVQSLRAALNTALLSDDRAYQFLLAGRALGAQGEWNLAAQAFRNAILQHADYAEAWAWLGETYQHLGQTGSSELEKAVLLNPDSAMIQGLYGTYLQRQDRPRDARAAFEHAAALEPENHAWQMALGSASEQAGDLVAAYWFDQRAVELAPLDVPAWQALASFCLRNNVDLGTTGLQAAQQLVTLAEDDWQSLDLVGQILLETGDPVGAESVLKKAVALDPTQAAPPLHLGLLYLQTGDRSAAYAYLTQAKTFDPDGPFGWQAKRLLEQYFP